MVKLRIALKISNDTKMLCITISHGKLQSQVSKTRKRIKGMMIGE